MQLLDLAHPRTSDTYSVFKQNEAASERCFIISFATQLSVCGHNLTAVLFVYEWQRLNVGTDINAGQNLTSPGGAVMGHILWEWYLHHRRWVTRHVQPKLNEKENVVQYKTNKNNIPPPRDFVFTTIYAFARLQSSMCSPYATTGLLSCELLVLLWSIQSWRSSWVSALCYSVVLIIFRSTLSPITVSGHCLPRVFTNLVCSRLGRIRTGEIPV